ncbi:HNH endonuclease [Timonella senegalensis]|uniref:HNH endonuclease n=1 Tax=Timonella senegalensis TaxID=1465825 RepID=UPI0035E429F9
MDTPRPTPCRSSRPNSNCSTHNHRSPIERNDAHRHRKPPHLEGRTRMDTARPTTPRRSTTRSGKPVESVTFRGLTFRRYPEAPGHSDQRYFVPGIADRQRGIRRLHEEIWMHTHNVDSIPDGWHVHHKDHNHSNNEPENLVAIPSADHLSHHGAQPRTEAQRAAWQRAQAAAAQWHASDAGRAWHQEHGREAWEGREYRTEQCDQCSRDYETRASQCHDRFCSNACKSAWRRASGLDDEERVCEHCATSFVVNRYAKTRFCSRLCASRQRRDNRGGLQPDSQRVA